MSDGRIQEMRMNRGCLSLMKGSMQKKKRECLQSSSDVGTQWKRTILSLTREQGSSAHTTKDHSLALLVDIQNHFYMQQ